MKQLLWILFLPLIGTAFSEGESAPTVAPATPPSATAAEFPRVIVGTVMDWCLPGSARLVQGELVAPTGEKIISGFYGNAPLVRNMEQEFQDMKAAGIDVLGFDFFSEMNVPAMLERYVDLARDSGTGVRVVPMLEPSRELKWTPDILKKVWEAKGKNGEFLRDHPGLLTVGNDKVPAFLTYDTESADVWKERLGMVRAAGGNAFVIGDVSSIEVAVTTKVPDRFREPITPLAGTYFFVSHTSGVRPDEKSIMPDFMRFGRSFDDAKVVGAGIAPGYVSSMRAGNLLSPRGTGFLRRQWLDVIENNPDFVHLTMLSDYSENTEMECSENSSFTFLDLARYFGSRWRTGRWPEMKKPEAFLSYKKTLSPSQKAEFELLVLDPKWTGNETAEEVAKRISTNLQVAFPTGGSAPVPLVKATAFPGHAVLEFAADKAWDGAQFAIPRTPEILIDGKRLDIAVANLAPITVLAGGAEASRQWFHIPLNRVRELGAAALRIETAAGESYPRTLRISGIDWNAMDGVVFERSPNPLSHALPSEEVKAGWSEPYYVGPGYAPMPYLAGWSKRWVADRTDSYFSVIRFKDGTVGFPRPAAIPAPRLKDCSVVQDPVIAPLNGQKNINELSDRGPLQRPLPLGPADSPSRAGIVPVDTGAPWWALRFDGRDDRIRQGPFTFPPVDATVEFWIKPDATDARQAFLYSQSACFNLTLVSGGTLELERSNERRQSVKISGAIPLEGGQWNHVAAVYAGDQLRLYVNGRPDGEAPCPGARTDEFTLIGGKPGTVFPKAAAEALQIAQGKTSESFAGDIARFRVLGHAASAEEIAASSEQMRETLAIKPSSRTNAPESWLDRIFRKFHQAKSPSQSDTPGNSLKSEKH
ncbi:MAG: hypothetical protein D4R65_02175 [Verrucomicrobiaceae bacterium]|nr:MAG: hypothetical protein D4R65_02175 [Verrucomicrobiaceae bacterium]